MLTTNFVPGAPDWVDLGTPDVEASVAFYTTLFGWDFASAGPEAGGYGMFMLNGRTAAAVGPLTEDGASASWTLYFHTSDADLTARTVAEEGGTVRVEPFDVFSLGRTGVFADPSGARFAVWEPRKTQGLDAVTLPGTLTWTELHTDDVAAAHAFYGKVFGWRAEDSPVPEGRPYLVVSTAGGGPDAAIGGITELDEERRAAGATPQWRPYFEVTDVDAVVERARAEGGRVETPAVEIEDVGRTAELADPFGAPFSVIRTAQVARSPGSSQPAPTSGSTDSGPAPEGTTPAAPQQEAAPKAEPAAERSPEREGAAARGTARAAEKKKGEGTKEAA